MLIAFNIELIGPVYCCHDHEEQIGLFNLIVRLTWVKDFSEDPFICDKELQPNYPDDWSTVMSRKDSYKTEEM